MKLEIAIEYTGTRIVHEGLDVPVYRVTTNGNARLCLTSKDVQDHVKGVIEENIKEVLHGADR